MFPRLINNPNFIYLIWMCSTRPYRRHISAVQTNLLLYFHLRLNLPSVLSPPVFTTEILYAPFLKPHSWFLKGVLRQ
jgi:hypothetical protein